MFGKLHNSEMIKGEHLTDPEDINQLRKLIFDHLERTDNKRSKAEPEQEPLAEIAPVTDTATA